MAKLTMLIWAIAAEIDRCMEARKKILTELSAKTTTDMISEYEKAYAVSSAGTISERRAAVLTKMNAVGGQSKEYFYTLAEKLGYNRYPSTTDPHIKIDTAIYLPFRCDTSKADQDHLWSQAPGSSLHDLEVSGTNVATDTVLQSLFNLFCHAHTRVTYKNS